MTDYLLAKTTDLINRLLVYPARMKRNLESTGGLIFSGQLLLDLAEAGMMREVVKWDYELRDGLNVDWYRRPSAS